MRADGAHILVVEDDEPLQIALAEVLTDNGFQVSRANGVTTALEILSGRVPIHVVFADVDLPGGRSGMDLYNTMRRHWPHIPVLLTSGAKQPQAKIPFLPKPYSAPELLSSISSVLGFRIVTDLRSRGLLDEFDMLRRVVPNGSQDVARI